MNLIEKLKDKNAVTVTSVSYDIGEGICVTLENHPYCYYINPQELHFGGINCEIQQLKVGGKIKYEELCHKNLYLHNVLLVSDGIREADDHGKLIRW